MKLDEVFVSAAQYAALRGVEDTYVHQLRRNGRLVTDERGRIALHASDDLVASTRQRRPRRGSAAALPHHPWAGAAVVSDADPLLELQRVIAESLHDAALALAPRVANETDVAACRSFLAQELGRAASKITKVVLAHHHAAAREFLPPRPKRRRSPDNE